MGRQFHFAKMHGLGNHFVLVDNYSNLLPERNYYDLESLIENSPDIVPEICNPETGVGADGLILVLKSDEADYKMRIFNSDGSEAEMCGNGIRCFADFVIMRFDSMKETIKVETLDGVKEVSILSSLYDHMHAKKRLYRVDMGVPEYHGEQSIEVIEVSDETFIAHKISVGNPHAVILLDTQEILKKYSSHFEELPKLYGKQIEDMTDIFPDKTNVEFIRRHEPLRVSVPFSKENPYAMVVWERGVGETAACGTGATACAFALYHTGIVPPDEKITIKLRYGKLDFEKTPKNNILMTGPAELSFTGKYQLKE